MQVFKTSPAGRRFIETNEGLILMPKLDAKGKYSIGYGHDILPGENYTHGITKQDADEILTNDLAKLEPLVSALVSSTCKQNQFDALMDFAYQEGVGGLRTMLAHGWSQVPVQILRWDIVEGKPSGGVHTRRQKELVLFNS